MKAIIFVFRDSDGQLHAFEIDDARAAERKGMQHIATLNAAAWIQIQIRERPELLGGVHRVDD